MIKASSSVLLKRYSVVLAICLMLTQICGLLAIWTSQGQPFASFLFPMALLVLGCFNPLVKGKNRLIHVIVSVILYSLLLFILAYTGILGLAWLSGIPGYIGIYLLSRIGTRAADAELEFGVWVGGIVLGLIVQALLFSPLSSEMNGLATFRIVLQWLYVLYVFIWFLSRNEETVIQGTHSGKANSQALKMMRRNRVVCTMIFVLAVLVSYWGKIAEILSKAADSVIHAVAWLIDLITSFIVPEQTGEGGGGNERDLMGFMGEDAQPSALSLFLEKVLRYVVIAFLAVVAIFLLIRLCKYLKKLIRRVVAKLKEYGKRTADDYVDETESIFNGKELTDRLFHHETDRKKKTNRRRHQPANTPGEKVRALFVKRYGGKEEYRNQTAKEIITGDPSLKGKPADAFSEIYDKARYSALPVSEDDLTRIGDLSKL